MGPVPGIVIQTEAPPSRRRRAINQFDPHEPRQRPSERLPMGPLPSERPLPGQPPPEQPPLPGPPLPEHPSHGQLPPDQHSPGPTPPEVPPPPANFRTFARSVSQLGDYETMQLETTNMARSTEFILDNKAREPEHGAPPTEMNGHQLVTHPTTYVETLVHLFRGNIGSGLLAMGDAFKNGGLFFSTIMTGILGIICVHAQHLLLNASEEMHVSLGLDSPPGFADTVRLVFAHGPPRWRSIASTMMILVNTLLCVTQLGFCCVYIVFIANNMKMIFDFYNMEIEVSVHGIFAVIPVLLSCMVRNLKYLTPFSTIANILMALGVSYVVYEATQNLPEIETRDYLASWQQLPLYFGTAIYAFEGIGLVLPLKNEMRNPKEFQKPLGVLNVGMVVVGTIFIVVGFLGYLKWGDEVQGSLTLNLQPGLIMSNLVQIAIALAILFTYPLQFYVPVAITWPVIKEKCGRFAPTELIYRAMLVLLTFVLAESIPKLGLVISLVGAVSSTALALIIPPLLELVSLSTKSGGISRYALVKNCIIIVLGFFIFVTGTYESVSKIIMALKE